MTEHSGAIDQEKWTPKLDGTNVKYDLGQKKWGMKSRRNGPIPNRIKDKEEEPNSVSICGGWAVKIIVLSGQPVVPHFPLHISANSLDCFLFPRTISSFNNDFRP